MAISSLYRAVLSAISRVDIDVKKSYKAQRKLDDMRASLYIKPTEYQTWEHSVVFGDHRIPVRVFVPTKGKAPVRTLLFFPWRGLGHRQCAHL